MYCDLIIKFLGYVSDLFKMLNYLENQKIRVPIAGVQMRR